MTCVCMSYLPYIVDVYLYLRYNVHATKHSPTIIVSVDVLIAVVKSLDSVARRHLYEHKYN